MVTVGLQHKRQPRLFFPAECMLLERLGCRPEEFDCRRNTPPHYLEYQMHAGDQSLGESDSHEQLLWRARYRAEFGTLWKVSEKTWIDFMSGYRGSNRLFHPGVSVRRAAPALSMDILPMLFGCTAEWYHERAPSHFVLAQLIPSDPLHKKTVFGKQLHPARIPVHDPKVHSTVTVWPHKARLDVGEAKELEAWCWRKRVWRHE